MLEVLPGTAEFAVFRRPERRRALVQRLQPKDGARPLPSAESGKIGLIRDCGGGRFGVETALPRVGTDLGPFSRVALAFTVPPLVAFFKILAAPPWSWSALLGGGVLFPLP